MLQFTKEKLDAMNEIRVREFHGRIDKWLSKRNVGWDNLNESDRRNFLAKNDQRGKKYGLRTEKSRSMLACSFLLSGDPEAFEGRADVQSVLTSERAHEFGKVRRLHAIAWDMARGSEPDTRMPKKGANRVIGIADTKEVRRDG